MFLNLTGTCTCRKLQHTVKIDSADSARTSLCHCPSCKKAFGTNYGWTSKEQAADRFRYITYGTLDDPEQLPPKGEFLCKDRSSCMPEIPGIFHKQQIKE